MKAMVFVKLVSTALVENVVNVDISGFWELSLVGNKMYGYGCRRAISFSTATSIFPSYN